MSETSPARPSGGTAEPIRFSLPEEAIHSLIVYFRSRRPPAAADLTGLVLGSLEKGAEEPLRAVIRRRIEENPPWIAVAGKDRLPGLPPGCAFGCRGDERRRIEEANRGAVVCARDGLRRPRTGLWAVAAAGRALAAVLDGALPFDPGTRAFRPGGPREGPLPGSGRIAVAEHICLYRSIGERGHGRVTTKGMEKFGLPDLELREVPPDLTASLAPVLDGIAQLLADRVHDLADRSPDPPRALAVEPEITVRLADSLAAFGEEAPPGGGGSAVVRLEWTGRARGDREPSISVEPPRGSAGGRGAWFHRLLEEMLGEPAEVRIANPDGKDAALAEAHRRAVAELGKVKARFARGLRPGEVLYVKRGFPHDAGVEYMWLAVNTWKGVRLQGQLSNQPAFRANLKAGDPIEVAEDEVFDWIIEEPDGSIEGGYTNIVLGGKGG